MMPLLTEIVDVPETLLTEGIVISVVSYVIVFAALLILYFVFDSLSKAINLQLKLKLRRQGKLSQIKSDKDLMIPGEVTAAIGLALFFATELHDEESNIITIRKVSRTYSPWSSKIYGLRGLNR